MEAQIIALVVSLIFMFVVMLLCRELTCWYFKLTKIVELLEKIEKKGEVNDRAQEETDKAA